MPVVATKHKGREQPFTFDSFDGGLTKEKAAPHIAMNQLSRLRNMKYVISLNDAGEKRIALKTRQGTTQITNTALGSDAVAVWYFDEQSQYIVATSSTLFYLDGNGDPQTIGALDGQPTFTEFHSKLIVHDTGVTKAWDGTTYETLNDYIVDEVLATGDDAETEFTGTLTSYPVEYSSLEITYTDTSTLTVTDNGIGRLTGDVSSSWVKTITGAASDGSGQNEIRITCVGHGFDTDDEINIAAVAGTTEANNTANNPTWTITKIDNDTFDLNGSVFTNAYTSGGTASKNTIDYATGDYAFKATGAPDSSTSVLASYEEDEGAPKSKAGFVRGSQLYLWGDEDNPERLWYCGTNDEDAWNSTSGGGYLDVGKNDGQELVGCINFYTSVLCVKSNSLHRIDAFPGDDTFQDERISDNVGSTSYRTVSFDADVVSFMSKEGLVGMASSDRFGDIQRTADLSVDFKKYATRYADQYAFTAYNRIDKQLWVALSPDSGTSYIDRVYVISIGTGGQLTEYRFAFGHASFAYINGRMLIGGTDGHLYQLDGTDSIFRDNNVSYASDTFVRSGFNDFSLPFNRKHNKKISIEMVSGLGYTATLNLYKNQNYDEFYTKSITAAANSAYIFDGDAVEIYSLQSDPIYFSGSSHEEFNARFNYDKLMWEYSNIYGSMGVEVKGISFKTAIIGD